MGLDKCLTVLEQPHINTPNKIRAVIAPREDEGRVLGIRELETVGCQKVSAENTAVGEVGEDNGREGKELDRDLGDALVD